MLPLSLALPVPIAIPVMAPAAPVICWPLSRGRPVAAGASALLELLLQLVIHLMRLHPCPAHGDRSLVSTARLLISEVPQTPSLAALQQVSAKALLSYQVWPARSL